MSRAETIARRNVIARTMREYREYSATRARRDPELDRLAGQVDQAMSAAGLNLNLAARLANNAGALSFSTLALQDQYGVHAVTSDTGERWIIDWPEDTISTQLAAWRVDLVLWRGRNVFDRLIDTLRSNALLDVAEDWARDEWWTDPGPFREGDPADAPDFDAHPGPITIGTL